MGFLRHSRYLLIVAICSLMGFSSFAQALKTDLLIIGGGASGTTAAIQAARMGVQVTVVEETPWLGGMLTAAGVTAIDGNHKMPAGLWGEFRQHLYDYYGGPEAVNTGWVSNTLFEPSVANKIFKQMVAAEKSIQVLYDTRWEAVKKVNDGWEVTILQGKKRRTIQTRLMIDATELGDVMAAAGAKYRIGMDARDEIGEAQAPEKANDIVQDLTYVVVLKDYGKGADKTIPKPAGYNPAEFDCCCDVSDPASHDSPKNNCFQMMQYGKLPNNKYMINWPKCGNDIYMNIIEKTPAEREIALKEAKLHTLRFLYYLQTVLDYKNLGIADDEYPTKDKLPFIPYHRESRRVVGQVTFTVNHVAKPYDQPDAFYRTGIAVGDYPIDHHHLKNTAAPQIDFVKIRVPSYNIPVGALVPQGVEGLIVAEKSISVSNIVNGATRLQPVVLGIGQAAGALAAVSLKNQQQPKDVNIREVQEALLQSKAYLMPFMDVAVTDPQFAAIQRVGATGILKGAGVPYKWANQTWFYPEQPVSQFELVSGLTAYYPALKTFLGGSGEMLTPQSFIEIMKVIKQPVTLAQLQADWQTLSANSSWNENSAMPRRTLAALLDHYLHPFEKQVDFNGNLKN
jgi:hypothetical protein